VSRFANSCQGPLSENYGTFPRKICFKHFLQWKESQRFEKLSRPYSECVRQRNDVDDRDIPFASLDAAYVIAM